MQTKRNSYFLRQKNDLIFFFSWYSVVSQIWVSSCLFTITVKCLFVTVLIIWETFLCWDHLWVIENYPFCSDYCNSRFTCLNKTSPALWRMLQCWQNLTEEHTKLLFLLPCTGFLCILRITFKGHLLWVLYG